MQFNIRLAVLVAAYFRSLAFAVLAGVLGAATANAQQFTEFPTSSNPNGIAAAQDGTLWFTMMNDKVARMTTAGVITEFSVPTANSLPAFITAGPDGNMWFTELAGNKIGKITPSGAITEYPLPNAASKPQRITAGPDGNLWFVEDPVGGPGGTGAGRVGKITTSGTITEYTLEAKTRPFGIAAGADGNLWFTFLFEDSNGPDNGFIGRITPSGTITKFLVSGFVPTPQAITAGSDGALWFTEQDGGTIGRVTTAGVVTQYPVATTSGPNGIVAGPDGALWFANGLDGNCRTTCSVTGSTGNSVGRITTSGVITQFTIPTAASNPAEITLAQDGGLWLTERFGKKIGRLSVPGVASPTLLAATLPSSRAVQVGKPATAFATIINAGSATATNCGIAPVTSVPGGFSYQTTNPQTNALTGTPNTPANIPAGGFQSYVIAFTANAPFVSTNAQLGFSCSNAAPAPSVVGLNTLLLTFDANPIPDIVALAASVDPGYVDLPGANGSGAFSVASVNVGSTASITVSGDTGSASLPVAITLCQTNAQAQCINPATPAATATLAINANATPTFSVFVKGSGTVANDPASNRVFVRFKDSGGITRGSTSVAVRTQ